MHTAALRRWARCGRRRRARVPAAEQAAAAAAFAGGTGRPQPFPPGEAPLPMPADFAARWWHLRGGVNAVAGDGLGAPAWARPDGGAVSRHRRRGGADVRRSPGRHHHRHHGQPRVPQARHRALGVPRRWGCCGERSDPGQTQAVYVGTALTRLFSPDGHYPSQVLPPGRSWTPHLSRRHRQPYPNGDQTWALYGKRCARIGPVIGPVVADPRIAAATDAVLSR